MWRVVSENTTPGSEVLSPIPNYGGGLYFAAASNAYHACHFSCFDRHLYSWQSHLTLELFKLGSPRSQWIFEALEILCRITCLWAYVHLGVGWRLWPEQRYQTQKSQKLLLRMSWNRKELKWLHKIKKWHSTNTNGSLKDPASAAVILAHLLLSSNKKCNGWVSLARCSVSHQLFMT